MARKKIILEVETENGNDGWAKNSIFDNKDCYLGLLMDSEQHYGEPEKQKVNIEEKIVYQDKPCTRDHVEDVKDAKFNPEPVRQIQEQSGVNDLIKLKESGFTVEDILQLRSEHLI